MCVLCMIRYPRCSLFSSNCPPPQHLLTLLISTALQIRKATPVVKSSKHTALTASTKWWSLIRMARNISAGEEFDYLDLQKISEQKARRLATSPTELQQQEEALLRFLLKRAQGTALVHMWAHSLDTDSKSVQRGGEDTHLPLLFYLTRPSLNHIDNLPA